MELLKPIALLAFVALMLQSGLQVDWATLKETLAKRSLLMRALLTNFVLVPLFAFLLVRALHLNPFIAAGILLMAIAPGVPFLPNAAGKKAGGSLGFALALCFIMPALSIVTAPLTARLILPAETHIPVTQVILTLVIFQLVPLSIGMLTAQRAPQLAAKLVRPLAFVVTIAIVAVLVVLAPSLIKAAATVYGSYGTAAALAIVLFSLAMGWLLGGPQRPYRNTLGVATALRNVGLALTVATLDFPGTPAAAMVAVYLLVQVIVTVLFRVFVRLMKAPGAPAAAPV